MTIIRKDAFGNREYVRVDGETLTDFLINPHSNERNTDGFKKILGKLRLAHHNGHLNLSLGTIMDINKVTELFNMGYYAGPRDMDLKLCALHETMMDVGNRLMELYSEEIPKLFAMGDEINKKQANAPKLTQSEISRGL